VRLKIRLQKPQLNRWHFAGLGALLVVSLMFSLVPAAWAEDEPTSIQLMEKCDNGTDSCEFHVSGPADSFWQPTELAAQTANCTDATQDAEIAWQTSVTSSNSIGVSLKAIVGASKVYMAGFKIAYSHEWTESVTDRDTTRISIPAGYMGRVYHSREMETVSGQYELHFGKRFYDHYYWYVPMSVTSPKTDGRDSVTAKSTEMTEQERATYCSS
jgi:hypothetical protein